MANAPAAASEYATVPGRRKIVLFGHFGSGNFGNESTLQAVLSNVRRLVPDVDVSCVCTAPEIVAAEYKIPAAPISEVVVGSWDLRNPAAKLARRLLVGIPAELYRWLKGIKTLWNQDMLVVVGTGLLTDAFGLASWGPYSVFKWSLIAKLCRCRLILMSVGAGPLNSRRGRLFVQAALSLASFHSYRDQATVEYLEGIGIQCGSARVFPDLAFSLPAPSPERTTAMGRNRRPVVGLGLMSYGGMYGVEKTTETHYAAYTQTLLTFAEWLLHHQFEVRLLTGDVSDTTTVQDFQSSIRARAGRCDEKRIIAQPITSCEDLIVQLEATDFVVATRFHNVLLGLFLNKPSIALSFHHKCSSLMKQMELSEYCQDIKSLNADRLIEQFSDLERNGESLRVKIRRKADECRAALEQQYGLILDELNTCE